MKALQLLMVLLLVSAGVFAQEIDLDEARKVIVKKWYVKYGEHLGEDKTDVLSKVTYDFKKDGSVVYYHTEMEQSKTGTWELSTAGSKTLLTLTDGTEEIEDMLLVVESIDKKQIVLHPHAERDGVGQGTMILHDPKYK